MQRRRAAGDALSRTDTGKGDQSLPCSPTVTYHREMAVAIAPCDMIFTANGAINPLAMRKMT